MHIGKPGDNVCHPYMHVVIQSGGGREPRCAFWCRLNGRSPVVRLLPGFYSVLAWPGREQGLHSLILLCCKYPINHISVAYEWTACPVCIEAGFTQSREKKSLSVLLRLPEPCQHNYKCKNYSKSWSPREHECANGMAVCLLYYNTSSTEVNEHKLTSRPGSWAHGASKTERVFPLESMTVTKLGCSLWGPI